MLPAPCSERWKPLRAGLVDLFYYDAEEFWFHDGRLLLRGNNGTGKSKVLALTLPFLLDGELAPHRVEPDGDRQKKMEWNLLLGGGHPHPERLGYAWLEFGRRTADGTTRFCTIGCGLKAVAGRGIARHWFFVTTQRVGEQLHLLPASRVPLTREKLRDEIDGHGLVYDRAADYRRAVDEALFGLGEHRYETLINLLIQLRQPQLSKKPDERLLSRSPRHCRRSARAWWQRWPRRSAAWTRNATRWPPWPRRAAPLPSSCATTASTRRSPPSARRPGHARRKAGTSSSDGIWPRRRRRTRQRTRSCRRRRADLKNSSGSGPGWRRGARRCSRTPRCATRGSWITAARTRDS
jgi:hypothetical protein